MNTFYRIENHPILIALSIEAANNRHRFEESINHPILKILSRKASIINRNNINYMQTFNNLQIKNYNKMFNDYNDYNHYNYENDNNIPKIPIAYYY